MNILRKLRQRAAYNRARVQIIAKWRTASETPRWGGYGDGYYDGLDAAVRIIARELSK